MAVISAIDFGIYHGLPFEQYQTRPGLNQSTAKSLLASQTSLTSPHSSMKRALILGSAGHCLLLEPDQFEQRYVRKPAGLNYQGTIGKQQVLRFESEHAGKIILEEDLWNILMNLKTQALAHPRLGKLFSQGQTEVSMFWQDAKTAIPCKGRLDWLDASGQTVLDLKFTRMVTPKSRMQMIQRCRYDLQAAWYISGLKHLKAAACRFILVFLQTASPYQIEFYEMTQDDMTQGSRLMEQALAHYLS